MSTVLPSRRAEAAREIFEEDRRGEVLRDLSVLEIEDKAQELGALINQRDRLDRDRKDQAKIAGEQIKELERNIGVLACETEYGKTWVPAQAQFDGLWGSGGLVPQNRPGEIVEDFITDDGEVITGRVAKKSPRKRKAQAKK